MDLVGSAIMSDCGTWKVPGLLQSQETKPALMRPRPGGVKGRGSYAGRVTDFNLFSYIPNVTWWLKHHNGLPFWFLPEISPFASFLCWQICDIFFPPKKLIQHFKVSLLFSPVSSIFGSSSKKRGWDGGIVLVYVLGWTGSEWNGKKRKEQNWTRRFQAHSWHASHFFIF